MAIRVLHLIGNLRLGGAQVCVKQLVEHNDDPEIIQYVYPLRSKTIDIPIEGNLITRSRFNYDVRKFSAILNICKEHRIDIIHAHLHKAVTGALLARFFCDAKVIVHEHGPIFRKGIQYTFYRIMLRLLRHRAAAVIANSQATARRLQQTCRVPESRIHVIYNAVDLETFRPDPAARTSIRQRFGFSDETIVIGFVGRLHAVKGIDLLVSAMPRLLENDPRFRLLICGAGPLREKLKKQIAGDGTESHIHLVGFQKDVAAVMNAFDIGCMPSRQEPFGMAALEMMSMRIPLVCSTADGLGEFIRDGENALALDTVTAGAIASRILELAGQPSLQETLRNNAVSYCRRFSAVSFCRQIGELYRTL